MESKSPTYGQLGELYKLMAQAENGSMASDYGYLLDYPDVLDLLSAPAVKNSLTSNYLIYVGHDKSGSLFAHLVTNAWGYWKTNMGEDVAGNIIYGIRPWYNNGSHLATQIVGGRLQWNPKSNIYNTTFSIVDDISGALCIFSNGNYNEKNEWPELPAALAEGTFTADGVIDLTKLPEKVITTPDAVIPLEDFYSRVLTPDGAIDGTYIGVLVGGLTDVASPPVDGDTDKPEVVPGVGLTYADVVKALETVFPKTSIKEEDFKQNPAIARKFPFCIPWDVVDVFRCLSAEPEAPVFKLNFYIPSMHIDEAVVLDLAPFAPVARTGRTMLLLLLIFGLALSTRSLIRG